MCMYMEAGEVEIGSLAIRFYEKFQAVSRSLRNIEEHKLQEQREVTSSILNIDVLVCSLSR
jgi:peroxiredoxin